MSPGTIREDWPCYSSKNIKLLYSLIEEKRIEIIIETWGYHPLWLKKNSSKFIHSISKSKLLLKTGHLLLLNVKEIPAVLKNPSSLAATTGIPVGFFSFP